MPKCSLIITLYNQARPLKVLLESALKQTEDDFEFVFADDGSSDDTRAIIEQFKNQHPEFSVKYIFQEDDGFGKTQIVNAAVKLTETPYLIFVDGDMILHHRYIEMHLKHAHPKRAMCGWRGCKIRQDIADKIIAGEIDFTTNTLSVLWRGLKGQVVNPFRTTVIQNKLLRKTICKERHHVSGGNYGIHKKNFELCNGMDESIRQYGYEDIEIGRRLQNNGIEPVGIRNCANTYHLEHGKSDNPGIKHILKRIHSNPHKQCKYGLKQLDTGSENNQFISDTSGVAEAWDTLR